MEKFNVGDKVKRKDGDNFSGGKTVETIERIEEDTSRGTKLWLKNGYWISPDDTVHAKPEPLTVRELLTALYHEDPVVSVDSSGAIFDTYNDLDDLEAVARREAEEMDFYLKEVYAKNKALFYERGTQLNGFDDAVKTLLAGNSVEVVYTFGGEVLRKIFTDTAYLSTIKKHHVDGEWFEVK